MATIENFLLKFKVDGQGAIDKASNSIKGLSDQVSQFGANTGPLNNALGGILGRLGPIGVAAGAAAGAFAALGLQAVNLAASISDIAGATGIAEGTLLNFRTSVIEAGGKADDFGQIAAKLNQNVQEAAGGNEKLQQSFRTLGVFVTDAAGNIRKTEDILRDITQRFQEGTLSGEQYTAAVDLLGKNITKLDLTKLQALADPVKDAEIQKLDEYSAAIDRIRDRLERNIITFFGQAAQQAEGFFDKILQGQREIQKLEEQLNRQGRTQRPINDSPFLERPIIAQRPGTTIGDLMNRFYSREMTDAEKAAVARKNYEDQMARLMAPYRGRPTDRAPGVNDGGPGGGYGKADPERLKREAEQRRKEAERLAEQLERELQAVNDMTAGYQRASEYNIKRYELQRNLLGATEYEKELVLGRAEIEKRYGDQIAALEAKKATAKDQTLKLINESIAALEQQRGKELEGFEITRKATFEFNQQQEAIKRITGEIEKQIQRQEQLGQVARSINDKMMDFKFEESLKGLSPLQQRVARINEEARKAALEAGRAFSAQFEQYGEEGLTPEQADELVNGINEITNAYKNLADAQIAALGPLNEFDNALLSSWETYKDAAMDTGKQVKDSFENFTQGMEDAFVNFIMKGKLSFKDLANSILADLARVAVKKAIVFFGTKLFGFADGGEPPVGVPSIVGEKGPELFVPKTAGTIIPNSALTGGSGGDFGLVGSTTVNYNINAVDAASFRSLVARDPSFIYAVTEQGRRSQPTRSR